MQASFPGYAECYHWCHGGYKGGKWEKPPLLRATVSNLD